MQLTVYTTKTCPFCKMQKEFFDSKGVKYQEILVDEHPEKIDEMINLSGQLGVPFTVINKEDGSQETVLGFDKAKFEQILSTL